MRVAVVSRAWWCRVHGGSEKFTDRVAAELARLGYEVHVVTATPVEVGYGEVHAAKPLPVKPAALGFSLSAARVVASLKPDAVLVNSYWSDSTLYWARLLGYRGAGVAVVHDAGFLARGGLGAAARRLLLKLQARAADVIVTPTEASRAEVARATGAERIEVIGFEGVDEPTPPLHLEDEWFDVLQVARFWPSKGHLTAIRAAEILHRRGVPIKLWLVGSISDPGYYRRVLEAARRVNVLAGWEAVRVVADAPSVEEYYRRADACVALSEGDEGYGLAVHECMAWGKPVVATEVFKRTGVAGEDRAIIVPPGDAAAVADALQALYEDAELRGRLAARGREWALARTWRAVGEWFDSLIRRVVGLRTPRA